LGNAFEGIWNAGHTGYPKPRKNKLKESGMLGIEDVQNQSKSNKTYQEFLWIPLRLLILHGTMASKAAQVESVKPFPDQILIVEGPRKNMHLHIIFSILECGRTSAPVEYPPSSTLVRHGGDRHLLVVPQRFANELERAPLGCSIGLSIPS
jgi:hypothetical protein